MALSLFRNGTWHDETLYRTAAVIHQTAAKTASAPPTKPPATSTRRPATLAVSRPEDPQARAKRTRAEAQKHWTDLLARYKESPYREVALYETALTYADTENWDQAAAHLRELVKDFPEGDRTGDALVQLIDIELERNFQIAAAESHAQTALKWLESRQVSRDAPAERAAAPSTLANLLPPPQEKPTTYAIHLRTGLIAYLRQDFPTAAAAFEKAKPFEPPRNFTVVHGTIPTGTERLIATAKEGKSLTPQSVREGEETAALILMLADIYHDGQQYERSLELCNRALEARTAKAKTTQRSYALFRRGRNHYCLDGDAFKPMQAIDGYLAAQKADPKAEWADDCLFLAANVHWNDSDKSTEQGKRQAADRAIALHRQLLRQYPKSEEADRAAYFLGVAFEWSGRFDDAKRAYEDALRRNPGTSFRQLMLNRLDSLPQK